ncbi:hypothetical protein Clacol_009721 [Clathrus columnatus]|uniref:Uncharacterized protein n=1 Tax=Clathrus columnatus TaxID=1419009 RepID=A0AAV5AQY2_9AGAM|nr:hypothetical protein Clacol_009721 [Clathrus columnatus]
MATRSTHNTRCNLMSSVNNPISPALENAFQDNMPLVQEIGIAPSNAQDGRQDPNLDLEKKRSKMKKRKTTHEKVSKDQHEAALTESQEPTRALKRLLEQGIPVAPPGVSLPGKEHSVLAAGTIEGSNNVIDNRLVDMPLNNIPQTPSNHHTINLFPATPTILRSTGVPKIVNFEIYSGTGDSSVCHIFTARVPVYALNEERSKLEIQMCEALQILATFNTPLKGPGPKLLSNDSLQTLEIPNNAWLPVHQENGKFSVALYWEEQEYKKGDTADVSLSTNDVIPANSGPIPDLRAIPDSSPPVSPTTIMPSIDDAPFTLPAPIRTNTLCVLTGNETDWAIHPTARLNAGLSPQPVNMSMGPLMTDSPLICWLRARFKVPNVEKSACKETNAEVALFQWRAVRLVRNGMEAAGWLKSGTKNHYVIGKGEEYTGYLLKSEELGLLVDIRLSTLNSDESTFSKAVKLPELWENGDINGNLKEKYGNMMSGFFGKKVAEIFAKKNRAMSMDVGSSSRNNREGKSAHRSREREYHRGRESEYEDDNRWRVGDHRKRFAHRDSRMSPSDSE